MIRYNAKLKIMFNLASNQSQDSLTRADITILTEKSCVKNCHRKCQIFLSFKCKLSIQKNI